MSEVKGISTITNRAGTGAVDFSNGVNISGSDSGLSGFKHTEGSTEPTSPSNGDTWWDTENEVYQIYVNDEWTTFIGESSAAAVWYGDRAIVQTYSTTSRIEYYDITTTGNAANFGGGITTQRYAASCSDGTYGLIMGGSVGSTKQNVIEYVTISTTGDASDFGDLTQSVSLVPAGTGDGTYGVRFGGQVGSAASNTIDYVTIATPGNAQDFGDLTVSTYYTSACSDGTYGVRMGGYNNTNSIDYITIATTGNATDFGDLLYIYSEKGAGFQDENGRGGVASGEADAEGGIQYLQIDTPSNASDFGDLTVTRNRLSSSSNATRATFAGGSTTNVIDYITVQTTGNAQDFGDLLDTYYANTGTSGAAS